MMSVQLQSRADGHPTNSTSTIRTEVDNVMLKDDVAQLTETQPYSGFSFDASETGGFADLFPVDLNECSADQFARKFDIRSNAHAIAVPDFISGSALFSGSLAGDDLVLALFAGGTDSPMSMGLSKSSLQ
jgi:hypothetical protein